MSRAAALPVVAGDLDLQRLGREMHELAGALFPICRSITGNGVRQTLDVLARTLPLDRVEVPSGTRAFDWAVPREWNVRAAWVKGPDGRTVVDVADHNLHLVGYSVPFHGRVSRAELAAHLHSLPEHPQWIPFRTSYYAEQWGFCVADDVKTGLAEGSYEVLVDTTLEDGSLTYAEHEIPGTSEDAVVISCHTCHPSMANDNLSAIVVAHRLARLLAGATLRHTYWFLFLPGTIGAVTWLARNPGRLSRIRHGLVLACLGDSGCLTYKRSRREDAAIDRIAAHVVAHRGPHRVLPFDPFGNDERQYCSPGIDLPVGRLTRTPDRMFAEYHTSADDLTFITPQSLADSLAALLEIVGVIEHDRSYRSTCPMGEPHLAGRRLQWQIGGSMSPDELSRAVAWTLNLSDGDHTLLDVAERASLPFRVIARAASLLVDASLLVPAARDRS